MKDFYDIYILISKNKDTIDIENLKKAIKNTFKNRKTSINSIEIHEVISEIEKDEDMKRLWKNYQKNAVYANKIDFEVVIKPLNYITSIL